MKNQLVSFLLGGLVFISFAASTTNIMTVKPAIPKSVVIVDSFDNARPYIRNGYIIKTSLGGDYHSRLILEKY